MDTTGLGLDDTQCKILMSPMPGKTEETNVMRVRIRKILCTGLPEH